MKREKGSECQKTNSGHPHQLIGVPGGHAAKTGGHSQRENNPLESLKSLDWKAPRTGGRQGLYQDRHVKLHSTEDKEKAPHASRETEETKIK